ncbi:Crp/Fnr family transcriptional regulator [Roseomonas sp. AR75]|uniref:Crp/Fnr family transcriptional regulator n=1 Tax=Roseomonas sp. AR75 TaxID=2562311 RepID=UPI0010C09CBF|nr:Crp/Fnr family transcriptional regulator [Roseomonas sp. AR75]
MPVPKAELARFPLLAALEEDRLAGLAELASIRSCVEGELLLDFDDESRDIFLILEGGMRIVLRAPSGHEMIFRDVGPGEAFGEIAAIDERPRSASVTAIHRTRLAVLRAEPFMAAILSSPAAALACMRHLTARLREKDERLLELTVLPVRLRLCAELLRLARPAAGMRRISPPPPHHELAARIGTRREVVSRELMALAAGGLIEADRRAIRLLRPDELEAELRTALGAAWDD